MIKHDLAPVLIGKDGLAIAKIYDFMEWHIHYVGRGGTAAFAISAVDIALWDIRCKTASKPLWQMAGGTSSTTKAYCGGIDLAFPMEKLLTNIQGYLDRGYNAVKIKVGRPNFEEDVARVRAVRELIGAETVFMVDANYSMSVTQAIRAAKAFRPYNILWFEAATIPDNYAGYARIAEATEQDYLLQLFCSSNALIKEFLAALLRGKKCKRSELHFESRACSGFQTFDFG